MKTRHDWRNVGAWLNPCISGQAADKPRRRKIPTRERAPAATVLMALALLGSGADIGAQTCFFYVDNEMAKVPILCVQKNTLMPPCAPPTDCTTVVNAAPQTVLLEHTTWHNCFGNTLAAFFGVQPPGRGQRWYAFHRQFELDFNIWREDHGFAKIESLNWCQGMAMPIGHPSGAPGGIGHVAGCGVGNPRPVIHASGPKMGQPVTCDFCEAFPPCLFYQGAGPNCGGEMGNDAFCTLNGTTYTALEQFPNVDTVSEVLDGYFHGTMHGAVGAADTAGFINDVTDPNCSPRDPMFWRLHKALDDVVRAWQDHIAADIILVIDKSGSMSAADSGGMTKLNAALQAARMFADILDKNRADGQVNRIGIVTFSSTATLNLPLTAADPTLLNPGGPLDTALNAIMAAGPGGATGIGPGLQKALDELCAGNCAGFVPPPGVNTRKGILLLTDGMENVPPCLGGTYCSGGDFDYNKLAFIQVCAVGFGNAGSLDGDLLTLLCERQGGIYMQNPAMDVEHDLKKFFVMGYGQFTDEFLLADPHGFLPANQPATEPITYDACSDSRLTFASGWKTPVLPGSLRLIVTTPSGELVRAGAAGVQSSVQNAWDYKRIPLPYRGESVGTWRAHLVRPHRTIVNGFTTDSFAKTEDGVALVRRQIQRLCPDGCTNVLYFEDGRHGPDSVYELALMKEVDSRLIGSVITPADAAAFAQRLDGNWDLIVYAHQRGGEDPEPYDSILAGKLCQGQRAIITENRRDLGAEILRCAGAVAAGGINWSNLIGDGRLVDGTHALRNPGYPTFTWGLQPVSASSAVQALGSPGTNGAIVAAFLGVGAAGGSAVAQNWFIGILGRGLSKLDPHLQHSVRRTGDDLVASVRMLPSYYRAGGYDSISARVEVTYPLEGLGNIFTRRLDDNRQIAGDPVDRRGATLTGTNGADIPTGVATFPLYDDGTHGDEHPENQYWTAILPGLGKYDGMYQFRYLLDFNVAGCITHRELTRSIFMDSRSHPATTTTLVVSNNVLPDGRRLTSVRITPRDVYTNMWGPGRIGVIRCNDPQDCALQQGVRDNGDGSYTVDVLTPPGVAGVRLNAFNAPVDLPITCPTCPRLSLLNLNPTRIEEFQLVTGTVLLNAPAQAGGGGGARVYLSSSDPEVAFVPESILVPTGAVSASFVISNAHGHGSNIVTITARYGEDTRINRFTVVEGHGDFVPFEITAINARGGFLDIDFSSPYLLDHHELQMRPTLQPADQWDAMQGNLSNLGANRFRITVPRPPGGEKFFRLRALFGLDPDHNHGGGATSAKLWDGRDDGLRRAARTVEYRQQPNRPIPDNATTGIRDALNVRDNLDLTGLRIYVNVSHTHVGDLVVELVAPNGKAVVLRTRSGATKPDLVGWYGVELPLPLPGLFNQFIGERANGEWTLRLSDQGAGDAGQLNEWALRLTGYERASLLSQK
jgi:subtilisin-like proprotein convertase family protein